MSTRCVAPWIATVVAVATLSLGASTRTTAAAAQAAPVDGPWQGQIAVGAQTLPFRVVFTRGASGLAAAIDIQTGRGVALRAVSADNKSVHFELPAAQGVAVFDGTFGPNGASGTFTQGTVHGTFTMTREAPPPYHVEDVTYRNGNITLAATLTIPEGKGPFPAVVMATGSGAENRDEELFGFKIFGVIADYLTRHGVAVLRADDRGVGGSTGTTAGATSADFAGDALAGLALLAARPEIDHARMGVFGHSEGGDIAAIAATRSSQVAFIVMMAGPALPGETVLAAQQADGARQLGATPEAIAAEQAAFHTVVEAIRSRASLADVQADLRAWVGTQYDARSSAARAAAGDRATFVDKIMPGAMAQISDPSTEYMLMFDPATVLRTVHCPVFAVFGGKDTQVVAATNAPALQRALAAAGNTHVRVKTYPDANHLFITAVTGEASEYAALPKTFVPGFLEDVASWISGTK